MVAALHARIGDLWRDELHDTEAAARSYETALARDPRLGLRWYQVDFAWYAIKALESAGLARDVHEPDAEAVERGTRSDYEPATDNQRSSAVNR